MKNRIKKIVTTLEGLYLLQRSPIEDQRGYFERMYCAEELRDIIEHRSIVQINHTQTETAGTVRGMHFQKKPHAELKIVSCLIGEVFDVAIDLRKGSPSFLHWHAERLSSVNHRSLIIPEGFAHGFQSLTDYSEIIYFVTSDYFPDAEEGVHPQDPLINICWPLQVRNLSPRDQILPFLNEQFHGLS
ncbi:dTDP-4-dehydrorhamnose 3,5-epimerase [Magnetovirga frankeli]|uniref:dTDP-4-dehydrorhamnose 3,5-epimerase n=1 Tax=Magnetovirga frankeli TaxID=947516 RepID=UPI0012934DB6|nr:dTDP-4-dehydrorhamnose 3,5-epimerase [gamma proteobacterium SS-5]